MHLIQLVASTFILPIAMALSTPVPSITPQSIQVGPGKIKPPRGIWISNHICAHNRHKDVKFYQVEFKSNISVKLSVFFLEGDPQIFTGTTELGSNKIYINEFNNESPFTYTITGSTLKLYASDTNDEYLLFKNPPKIVRINKSFFNAIKPGTTWKLLHTCDGEFRGSYTSQSLIFNVNGTISITYYDDDNTSEVVSGRYKFDSNRLCLYTKEDSELKEVFLNGDHLILRDIDSGIEFHYAIDSIIKE